jgi:hypothetical protein
VPRPRIVDVICISRKLVLTRFNRLGVDTKLRRFSVDTKFTKLGLETRLSRLGVETIPKRLGTLIKGRIEEANSAGSIKLLMYRSSPAVVEIIVD